MEAGPIFLAGIERSGTSLMYALLASHPNIAMTRRTNLWSFFYNQYGELSQAENFENCLAAMLRYKRLLKLQPDPERIRREFGQGRAGNEQLGAAVLKNKAQTAIAAALKQFVPQFAYAETAVHVRLAVAVGEVAESQQTFHPFALRKLPQASEDRRVDGEKLTQASL